MESIVLRVGPVEVDIPRSIGYFGGVGCAVAVGLIEPPLGVFIAAVPFLKMLNVPGLPLPANFVGRIVEGMGQPVGSDAQGTTRIAGDDG